MHPAELRKLLAPEYIRTVIIESYEWMHGAIRMLKNQAFEGAPDTNKSLSVIDLYTETFFFCKVKARFQELEIIKTEDVVPDFDVTKCLRTCMLIDILDGAHMHQRRLSNWCSAITVFDRIDGRIHAAYVVLPATERLYYATEHRPGAFSMEMPGLSRIDARTVTGATTDDRLDVHPSGRGWNRVPLRLARGPTALEQATVCMSSQRCTHLAAIAGIRKYPRLAKWLRHLANTDRDMREGGIGELAFRFYNLGGNPMLARICDSGADVVMDWSGELPNDWVPGAYIAARAGAFLGRPDGTPITEQDMGLSLLKPGASRTPYIAASSEQLFRQVVSLLQ